MIVAITGGTGFIGRYLIARHVALGDQVRYLTRRKGAADIRGAFPHQASLGSSMHELHDFVSGADVLYHCAAELRNESAMHDTNVIGTANLLDAATGEIGRWVQLSSTGVYGSERSGDIHEDSELNPLNAYEKSKAAADKLVCAVAEKQNLPCVVLRPSIVYGTNMPNQSLFQLIRMIDRGMFFHIGKPGAMANYIHVENVVDALLLCGTTTLRANCSSYIVSDHRSMEDFIGIIATALGKKRPQRRLPEPFVRVAATLAGLIPKSPLKPSRVNSLTNRTVYRTERIEIELRYKHKISMEEGIGELTRHWKRGSA